MALTRPRFGQLNTGVISSSDPITVLHAGATTANVDVGFLINRANGLVSNVALYWNESGNTFVTAFTSNTGLTDSNIAVTSYANITAGNMVASTVSAGTIGNVGAVHTGSTLALSSWANIAGPLVVTNNTAVQAIQVAGTSTKGGAGYHDFLLVTNQGGGTNPSKTFRLNSTGSIEIINSAYSTNIFTLTDAGALTVPAISAGGSLGTSGQVLSSTGSGLQWVASGGFSGGSVPNQTTFSSNVVANSGTSSTGSTTGAIVVNGGIGVSGNVWAGQVYATNNGNGTNFAVGDDTWIGDINIANTMGIKGQQDATQGYIVFGNSNNTNYIGRSGTNPITVTGAFSITGNTAITSTIYGQGIYDNGNRVVSTSSGAGNLSIGGTAITLPSTGPGATTVGSSTSIPVITTDAYGRVTALTSSAVSTTINLSGTSGTGSVAGGGTLTFASTNGITATVSSSTVTISSPQDLRTSASPTFAGGTLNGTVVATTLNAGTIGNANAVLYGTLNSSSASQTNITAVGNLTSLAVSGTTSTRGGKNMVTNFTGATAPGSPQPGDEWYYTTSDILYKYVYDGTNYQWIDLTSPLYNTSTSATANTIALRDTGGNLTATNFIGLASSAKYADLAEIYIPDQNYNPGTVVIFGGTEEITVTNISHDPRVAGVISTNPAYLMNSETTGLPVAFTGRVPCLVQGPVTKGELLVTSNKPGVAHAIDNTQFVPGCVIGKSLENITTNKIATIEVVVGRF